MNIDVTSLYNRRKVNRWERVSVGDMLERLTYSFPDKEAIVGWEGTYAHPDNARLTYQQANDKANQFANALLKKGLNRGDRILFFCDNSVEAFLAKIAVAKAGMVAVPINTMMAPDVISYLINLVEPKFFIVDSEHWSKISPVFENHNIKLDITIPIKGDVIFGSQSFEEFLSNQAIDEPDVEIHGDDIWQMLFTSGTTSMPKCVMISHTNTYFAAFNFSLSLTRGVRLEGDLKVCSFLPMIYHVGDQVFSFSAFLAGGTFVIGRTFDFPSIAQAITDEKVTALWSGSPAFLTALTDTFMKNEEKYNPTSLTTIVYGWASLNPEYHKKLKAICGNDLVLFEIFGQTESIACYRFWHDKWPETYEKNAPAENYVGVPSPLLSSVIMDNQGNIITEPRVPGEAVYRSPTIMSGYYKDEEATRKAFEHGWFHSGDSCMYDEDGLAIMVDRYKDVIKSGGENVSSIRVETILRLHSSVEKVAVIALPHEKWGEMVTGVVVMKEGERTNEEELINFCRERLAGFETPKQIIFVDSLPETVGGKVLKYKLREQLQ
ncbi:class I adenylate-forming enzyme family protein [Alkalihalobacterium alkalinitrilicum]|uniref:class I adenylate-forming enzyme family protein n=1 Tax=Alkalihalobacterium alkalinitrilicum TaxID=427920 RepID=UPI0009956A27|nr:AMP-binding protein [Alkalihalobacterium alkalinitrilicum]